MSSNPLLNASLMQLFQAPGMGGNPLMPNMQMFSPGLGMNAPMPQQQMPQQPMQQIPPQMQEVEQALMSGMDDATGAYGAFEAGVAPFEREWKNTQERRFTRGGLGLGEIIYDMIKEKKLAPQRQAVDAQRAEMQMDYLNAQRQQRIGSRAQALEALGNAPEVAQALAIESATDENFDPSKYDKRLASTTEERNRSGRREFLAANPDLVQRLGRDGADEFWMTGGISNDSGITLTHDPDTGFFAFTTGDGQRHIMPPTKATENEIQKTLVSKEVSNEKLESLMKKGRREFLEVSGRIKSIAGKGLDALGWGESELAQFNADRSSWVNQVLEDVMKYRKEITGVAGGPAEMKKIESMRANPRMGPEEFARNIEEIINTAQQEQNTLRRAAGYDPIDYEPFKWEWEEPEEDNIIYIE